MDVPDTPAPNLKPYAILAGACLLVGFLTGVAAGQRIEWRAAPGAGVDGVAGAGLGGSYSEVARRVMPAVGNIYSTRVVRSRPSPSPFFGDDMFRQEAPRERREQSKRKEGELSHSFQTPLVGFVSLSS